MMPFESAETEGNLDCSQLLKSRPPEIVHFVVRKNIIISLFLLSMTFNYHNDSDNGYTLRGKLGELKLL